MTSNPRQTRTGGNNEATNAQPTDARRAKTFMDKWVEPPLRPPAPSFMDNPQQDIVRHGVLSSMAPLGTLPSSKVKKLAKSDGPRRLAFAKKGEQPLSAASTPREAVTPEPPVNPSRRRSESHKMDEEEWNPTTPVAQSGSLKGTTPARHSSPFHVSPYSVPPSPKREVNDNELAGKVVKWAVKEAVAAGRLLTAYALMALFRQQKRNPGMAKLFIRIARMEANEKEHADFQGLIHFKKKEGRKDLRAAEQELVDAGYIPSTPVQFSAAKFNSSRRNGVPEAIAELTRSPHKEVEGPLHKKHKTNHLDDNKHDHNHTEVNGHVSLANGTPLRSRSNSGSPSSDSELSEIDEARLREDQRENSVFSVETPEEATGKRRSTKTGKPSNSTTTVDSAMRGRRSNRSEPMAQQRTLGPKMEAWDSNANSGAPSTSSSTPSSAFLANNNQNLQAQNMPTASSDTLFTPLSDALSTQASSQPSQHPGLRFFKRAGDAGAQEADENDRKIRLKRKAKDITENSAQVHESYDRHQVVSRDPSLQTYGGESSASGQTSRPGQILRFRSNKAGRRINDDCDELSSPTLPSLAPDGAPGSSTNSRAGTPSVLNRPGRRPKSGLRMKTSPMKKKAGPSAGIPRASGERNSPIGNGGLPHNQDDNDDYCSSCGGNGDLVCCDGCTRSFHFRCVDPPLSESQLPDNWFCNHCNASRNPRANHDFSVFGQLIAILHKKNPSAFHLPKEIREYFEAVRTGGEGEYEEAVPQKPKRNAGYEEPPDYLRLKDGKGNFILCHECNRGAGDGRVIIACSFCSLQWHLDCLDPPLANPPPLGKPWRCPCHVDDLLANVPGALGPAHRFRKIKGASVTKPAFARGFKNDGHIEIEFAESDAEEEGFFERKEYGKVYKLPELGIKLDFLSRARSLRAACRVSIAPDVSEIPKKQIFTAADRHSIQERQAALNVAQLATQDGNSDGAQTLINALISQASPAVVALMAQGDASNIAKRVIGQNEKQSLLAMKAMIEEALQQSDRDANPTPKEFRILKEEISAKDDLMLI